MYRPERLECPEKGRPLTDEEEAVVLNSIRKHIDRIILPLGEQFNIPEKVEEVADRVQDEFPECTFDWLVLEETICSILNDKYNIGCDVKSYSKMSRTFKQQRYKTRLARGEIPRYYPTHIMPQRQFPRDF